MALTDVIGTRIAHGLRVCMAACICLPAASAADSAASEYAVKAAIVYKIAKFVSWPQGESQYDDRLCICVPQRDPIGPAIDALAGEMVHGRTIEIQRINTVTAPTTECEILYLSRPTVERHRALLNRVADAPVLTIGDSENFVESGGIVSLEIEQSRVQFAINVDAGQRAGLDISAQLLQLAKIDD